MCVSPETDRRALIAVIAAAYRVLETWETGDLAGRVTTLGETARHWDAALGLGVTGLMDDLDGNESEEEVAGDN